MSKGLGKFQHEVLDAVHRLGRVDVPRPRLHWDLAGDASSCERIAQRVGRTVKTLERRSKLIVNKRHYETWEEFQREYPYRANSADVRDMRKRLLPQVDCPQPFFAEPGQEEYIVKQGRTRGVLDLSPHDTEWRQLERELIACMATVDDHQPLFLLVARGYQLFRSYSPFDGDARVECDGSFLTLLDQVSEQLPHALNERLRRFAAVAIPIQQRGRVDFKNRLFMIANFKLKPARAMRSVLDELYREPQNKTYMQSLPGHREGPFADAAAEYDELLYRLIDQYALAAYEVLSLPSPSSQGLTQPTEQRRRGRSAAPEPRRN